MANPSPVADRLAPVLAPVLERVGVQLYDVDVRTSGRTRTLRVLIDREGGVDLDTITAATETLAPVLDRDPAVAALLPGAYVLEVSSPGVERTLRTPAHFQGALGARISLKTRSADGTSHRVHATLVDADDEGIEVETEGGSERIGYGDVVAARTVFEWGPAPKPGKPGSRTVPAKR